jgi:hypothetical protein
MILSDLEGPETIIAGVVERVIYDEPENEIMVFLTKRENQ